MLALRPLKPLAEGRQGGLLEARVSIPVSQDELLGSAAGRGLRSQAGRLTSVLVSVRFRRWVKSVKAPRPGRRWDVGAWKSGVCRFRCVGRLAILE